MKEPQSTQKTLLTKSDKLLDFYEKLEDRLATLEKLAKDGKLTTTQIDFMAPSEKYDIYRGDLSFALTKDLRKSIGYTNKKDYVQVWIGICHGWAAASLVEKRPDRIAVIKSKTLKYKIKFYPHDIKALLSYFHSGQAEEANVLLGQPCRDYTGMRKGCSDIDPYSFQEFIVRSMKEKAKLVIDLDPGTSIWNQPIETYSLKEESVEKHKQGLRKSYTLTLKYGKESSPNHKIGGDIIKEAVYLYAIETNSRGKVIDSYWLEGSFQEPDFLWTPAKALGRDSKMRNSMLEVKDLYSLVNAYWSK